MGYGELLNVVVTFFGVTSAFAYLHQAYLIRKRKSSADVSIFTFAYFFTGQFFYLLYGFHLGSFPIIATFVANMIGSGLVIAMAVAYRKGKPNRQVLSGA